MKLVLNHMYLQFKQDSKPSDEGLFSESHKLFQSITILLFDEREKI